MIALILTLALWRQEPSAGSLSTPDPVSPSVVREAPRWIRKPSGEDLAKNYPRKAEAAGLEGRVTMVCEIAATGQMRNCVVADESPREYGFAEATLRLAPYFRMSLGTGEGSARVGGMMRIPMIWRLPR